MGVPHRRWNGALWNIGDQGVNSLGNLILSVVVASQVSARSFGSYAIVIGIYLLVLAVEQSLVGEALLVLVRDSRQDHSHERAAAAALQIGIAGAFALSVASLVVSRVLSGPMLVLACLLPTLMLQDALRFVAFARQRAKEALVNDAIWTTAQVCLTVAALLWRHQGVGTLVLAWGIGAALSAAVSYRRLQLRRLPWRDTGWFGETRYLSARYLVEALSTVGAFQVAIWLAGGVVGLSAAGGLRLAQVVFGPVHVVFNGWRSFLTPRLVRALRTGDRLTTLLRGSAVALLAVTAAAALVLASLPSGLATRLFGPSWSLTGPLIPLVATQKALEAVGLAPFAYLRATKRTRLTASIRAVAGLLIIAATAALSQVWGIKGAAAALALGSLVTCSTWWLAVSGDRWTLVRRIAGYQTLRRTCRGVCVRWRHRRGHRDDLYVVSYPKSGNTWLRFVLADAYSGEEPDFDSVEAIAPRVGEHHGARPLMGASGRLIKSHEPRHGFFERIPGRHLYVVRDGRDVAVSYYYHMLRRGLIEEGFSMFLMRFLTGQVDNYGRWQDHVTSWLAAAAADPGHVTVVRYEDLLQDAYAVTAGALAGLGCELVDDLGAAFDRHSSHRMRNKESTSQVLGREEVRRINFVRSARAGDWKSHFNAADLALFWDHAGEAMRAAGYEVEIAAVPV